MAENEKEKDDAREAMCRSLTEDSNMIRRFGMSVGGLQKELEGLFKIVRSVDPGWPRGEDLRTGKGETDCRHNGQDADCDPLPRGGSGSPAAARAGSRADVG